MKLIYQTVREALDKLLSDADYRGRVVKYIELNDDEFNELCWECQISTGLDTPRYRGHEIRRECVDEELRDAKSPSALSSGLRTPHPGPGGYRRL